MMDTKDFIDMKFTSIIELLLWSFKKLRIKIKLRKNSHLTAWEKIEEDGKANLIIETGDSVSQKNPHNLGLDIIIPGRNVGVHPRQWTQKMEGDSLCFSFPGESLQIFRIHREKSEDIG